MQYNRPLRILTISPGFPYPPDDGTKIQTFNRLRCLAARNEVTLLCVCSEDPDPEHMEMLRRFCRVHVFAAGSHPPEGGTLSKVCNLARSVWGLTPYYLMDYRRGEVEEWLKKNLRPGRFDVVETETASGVFIQPWWPALKVYINHSVHTVVFKRELTLQKGLYRKISLIPYGLIGVVHTKRVNKTADLAVALTPQSEAELRSLHPSIRASNCLTNGVDLDYFGYRFTDRKPSGFAFVGQMSYPPNVEAVLHFYHEIFPIIRAYDPEMRFFVIGSSPAPEVQNLSADGSVLVTGRVEDVREYLLSAGIAVIPTLGGGGILNKVLEALALGVPVVTRSNSVEGLSVRDGVELLIANDPADFAGAVVRLLEDENLRKALSVRGRKYVEKNHQWEQIILRYEDALREHLSVLRQDSKVAPSSSKLRANSKKTRSLHK
jgi:glycosyltransferase involved in cell wall biosynthesis